jgi:thioredoxin 1
MKNVTKDSFEEFTKDGWSLIKFHAVWCPPCKILQPILEKAETKYSNLRFAKVNVETQEDLAERFKIESMPTLILFKDGKKKAKLEGGVSLKELETWLKSKGAIAVKKEAA